MNTNISIYVACLASYNNGILHGAWINACQSAEDMRAEISEMLRNSPIENAEEYAIHDYDGFEGAEISEYSGLEYVANLAAFIEEHGQLGGLLVSYLGDLSDAREAIEDRYCGEYRSLSDFAQEITEETTEIPPAIAYYIDWRGMARDMEVNDVIAIETGFESVHVFWRH